MVQKNRNKKGSDFEKYEKNKYFQKKETQDKINNKE